MIRLTAYVELASPAASSSEHYQQVLLTISLRLFFAMRKLLFLLGILALLGAGAAWFVLRYRVPPMPVPMHSSLPLPHIREGTVVLTMPNGNLVGMVGRYTNELMAYLRFEYLQGLADLSGSAILLRTREEEDHPVYLLYVVLPNDLLEGSQRLAALQIGGLIPGFSLESPPSSELQDWDQQTRVFDAAYHQPVRQQLLQLPRDQLTSSVAQFILFKVRTDRRVRKQLTPIENVLSRNDALRFASDMIDLAKFYNIPLSMLLGIGAMENNYMSIRGDFKHASWKRRAQPGDLVLKRRRGKVLVSNYSQGAWQITRETLRYAHALYMRDTASSRAAANTAPSPPPKPAPDRASEKKGLFRYAPKPLLPCITQQLHTHLLACFYSAVVA